LGRHVRHSPCGTGDALRAIFKNRPENSGREPLEARLRFRKPAAPWPQAQKFIDHSIPAVQRSGAAMATSR